MNNEITMQPMNLPNQTMAINHWLVCGPFEQKMKFKPVTMEGEINTWLVKGFAIHEHPSRREVAEARWALTPERTLAEHLPLPGEARSENGQTRHWQWYMPWGNPYVELSDFWFVPTKLVSYAVTQLVVPQAKEVRMTLRTCGAATLWVNGELAADFAPYTRNLEQQISVNVKLRRGLNRLEVRFEDLAERDTKYVFRLDVEDCEAGHIVLPIGDARPETVYPLIEAMEAAYIEEENVTDGDVVLRMINPTGQDLPLDISWGNFLDGISDRQGVFPAGRSRLVLGSCEEIGMGYQYVNVRFHLDGLVMERRFGVETHLTAYDLPNAEELHISERKRAALRCIAERGSGNIHTAAAILHTGGDVQEAIRLIRRGVAQIRAREDCSDFYLVGLFRLWQDFRATNVLPQELWDDIKDCILSFRYWIDEPGDDVMWFFSENHALLFHACELLAGEWFPEEIFTNSGETGEVHRRKAEERLQEWFARFFQEGLAEWNSNAYIPIDALGLLHLYDLSASQELRTDARKALDLLFYWLTIHAHEGRLMATYGRSYEKELKGHYAAGTTSMCWIAYGIGNVNAHSLSNVIFCLSDYEPPESYRSWLLPDGQGFQYGYEQGAGGYARLSLYKTRDFVLSSIQDYRPGENGYQEHVMHYAVTPEAQIWVNHPGELHSFGSGRPSFWAGNGILPKVGQYAGLTIMLFRIDDQHDADYTHAFLPIDHFDEWVKIGKWVLVRKKDAYAALWCRNGMVLTETGVNRRREWVSPGRDNIWILRASNATQSGSFEQFVAQIRLTDIEVDEDLMTVVTDLHYGKLAMGWKAPLTLNDEEVSLRGAGIYGSLVPLHEKGDGASAGASS